MMGRTTPAWTQGHTLRSTWAQIAAFSESGRPRRDVAVTEAREILAAMEAAKAAGQGAAVYKGRLVDIASMRQAEVIVRQAELIGV